MCSTLRLALLAKGLKLSIVVSTGNEAQLTTEHFLEFLIDDDATEVIVLFMEQVRDPALFLELAARARERKKPIVLMHPGRSARAQESARTHTGAMVGNHAVMSALVAHEAVVRVETLEELLDTAEILARFAAPPVKGAAVMTNSGAFKGYALDFAETLGLDLPALSPANAEAIKKILPPFAAIENPVDTTAQTVRDPSILGSTAAQLLADPAMGSLVISIVAGAPRFAMDKANAILSGIGAPISKNRSRSPPWATRPNCRRNSLESCATKASPFSARRIARYAPWRGRPGTATPWHRRVRARNTLRQSPACPTGSRQTGSADRVSRQGVAGDARHRRPGRRTGARSRRGERDRKAGRLSRRLEGASRRAGA